MKDIVIVTGSMVRGGAEGVIATIANGLSQRGWKVYIISILFNRWDYKLDPTIECIDISDEKRNQVVDTPRLILTLKKKLRQIEPYAVLSFMVAVNIVTWLATRGLNTRYIPSERNDPDKGRSQLVKRLQAKAYEASDMTVFQTTRAKEYFSKKIQEKGIIIPNPLREMPEALYGITKRIVTVGRLCEQKNHRLLINTFEQVYKNYPEFRLDIYGEGNLHKELQKLIDEKGLQNAVSLKGKVNDIPNRIRDAYMFVLSSDYEGLSNALMEALGIGLPCISTDCAGASDLIKTGINGYVVPINDTEKMYSAIEYLIDNPTIAFEIGKAGRVSMAKYREEKIIQMWEESVTHNFFTIQDYGDN